MKSVTTLKYDVYSKYDPFFLCVIYKEGLCPSSGDINRLMMIIFKIRIASEVSN
jgi:hypothetical protein